MSGTDGDLTTTPKYTCSPAEAALVSEEPAISVGRGEITCYLKDYLLFLAEAGNHVLPLPPRSDSDDDRDCLMIDYFTMVKTRTKTITEPGTMYGISTDKINEYLWTAWLHATLAVGGNANREAYCLAEYCSTSVSIRGRETCFHLRMSSPRLKPLCSQEALLYFGVDELLFYKDADLSK